MNVSLTPELEELISQKVSSGLYHSASEVIREALRLLKEQDELRQFRREQLRKEVAIGLEQLDRGEGIPGKAVFEKLRQKSRARRKGRT
ncbi:MAG: type II toxin-antitoxin system ParD family antitoxin [Deltaproteobacteria bacterium]|nr:type II toxin-antitoxin system ParD family antitoxin [Deltaproteobacteria bacterium]